MRGGGREQGSRYDIRRVGGWGKEEENRVLATTFGGWMGREGGREQGSRYDIRRVGGWVGEEKENRVLATTFVGWVGEEEKNRVLATTFGGWVGQGGGREQGSRYDIRRVGGSGRRKRTGFSLRHSEGGWVGEEEALPPSLVSVITKLR